MRFRFPPLTRTLSMDKRSLNNVKPMIDPIAQGATIKPTPAFALPQLSSATPESIIENPFCMKWCNPLHCVSCIHNIDILRWAIRNIICSSLQYSAPRPSTFQLANICRASGEQLLLERLKWPGLRSDQLPAAAGSRPRGETVSIPMHRPSPYQSAWLA